MKERVNKHGVHTTFSEEHVGLLEVKESMFDLDCLVGSLTGRRTQLSSLYIQYLTKPHMPFSP